MVISASALGKLKTAFQVAMVLVLIAVGGRPLPVKLLVYATVVVTVLSGLDYFFGLRRQPQGSAAPSGRAGAHD
jgi:CDP-diacylglycerol--glycerol-3-phosphate 3-phosphatidyltransferase